MVRKGKKRNIQVWGVTLMDGTQIKSDDEGIVSVFANGDKTVSITDGDSIHKIVEGAEWASYVPRFN